MAKVKVYGLKDMMGLKHMSVNDKAFGKHHHHGKLKKIM